MPNLTTQIAYTGWPEDPQDFGIVVEADDVLADLGMPNIPGQSDPEYQTRIDADRATAQWKTASSRKLDSGKEPITDSPLFGGPAQGGLF